MCPLVSEPNDTYKQMTSVTCGDTNVNTGDVRSNRYRVTGRSRLLDTALYACLLLSVLFNNDVNYYGYVSVERDEWIGGHATSV
jgi:hypothetical protein